MRKTALTAALFVAAAITSGCGSSGSSSMMDNNTSAAKTISGAVADGYLVNALVFQDLDGDYLLDPAEPSVRTKEDGTFEMAVVQTGKPIVAVAIAGETYDLDDLTKTPLTNSYVLSMHGLSVNTSSGSVTGSASNFISPISTQIREMMETGKYSDINAAITELKTSLGMPTVPNINIMGNYIANGNSSMHTAARNMASLMGGQAGQVMPGNKVDINRYRSMMGSVFGNISTVRAVNPVNPTQNAVMTQLRYQMRDRVLTVPAMVQGQPFRNFSAAYRPSMGGGMMGGR